MAASEGVIIVAVESWGFKVRRMLLLSLYLIFWVSKLTFWELELVADSSTLFWWVPRE